MPQFITIVEPGPPRRIYSIFAWERLDRLPRNAACYSHPQILNWIRPYGQVLFPHSCACSSSSASPCWDAGVLPVDSGLTKIVLQADWYPQPEHGGFYTALAKGYYKDEGLDVTILPGGPYVSMEQQVASGGAQFGMGSSDKTLESVSAGLAHLAVAATMQRDPQGIMVRKDSPIRPLRTSMATQSRSSPGPRGLNFW